MKIKPTALLLLLASFISVAQPTGFWDKERATTKEVIASAGARIVVSSEELPTGTTEIVYRITLLDENQQLANSLVSVLKAIPDPTGISQGSAGAVLLLSKISGDDKCKYAIFTNKESALAYQSDGKTNKACMYQDNPVNKDAKRLSLNSTCLKSNKIWLGFESKNWIMTQRIVLEIVPWVDYKRSNGWNSDTKTEVINICKTTEQAKKIPGSDYCVCVLGKIQDKYRYPEYRDLLAAEKTKAFRDAGTACFTETNASRTISDNLRAEAANLTLERQYAAALEKWESVITIGNATVSDYNALGLAYLFTRQYDKAVKYLKEAEKMDTTDLQVQLNLAHAALFKGNYSQAKAIHKKYRAQNVTANLTWSQKVKTDFEAFKKAGLSSEDFQKILKIVE